MLGENPKPRILSHTRLTREAQASVEQPAMVVGRFINFTQSVLADSHDVDVEWEHEMHLLFGNEELESLHNDRRFRGVLGIKDDLIAAYENGGLPQLKATFIVRAIEHTKVANLGEACIIAFKGVIDFK